MKIVPWRLVVVDYGVHWSTCNLSICILTRLPSASTLIRLHCATSKSSLWNMEYVARGGASERPHIYRTSTYNNESTKVQTLGVFLGIDRSMSWKQRCCLCVLCKYVNGNVYKHSVLQKFLEKNFI